MTALVISEAEVKEIVNTIRNRNKELGRDLDDDIPETLLESLPVEAESFVYKVTVTVPKNAPKFYAWDFEEDMYDAIKDTLSKCTNDGNVSITVTE